ncbi:hypothetical protein NVV94_08420 [Pseudomonas sp. LS1212]|uniref:hypothetical protein n=1 Tax=Pseudomonas sp. LS1212 TaxID=2972478 RepID=UPI00215C464D|nr:hypothetical protein [Pseudomonas sp. LS1212]UVJ45566.1 hypothetical protein NVV94_08420 [Pseudomonas sp. LS1212]
MEGVNKANAVAETIKQSIASLREAADKMSAAGRQAEADAINFALDDLQKSLKRIRVDECGQVKAVH